MARSNLTILTCDRCGKRQDIIRPDFEYSWANIYAREFNGPHRVGVFEEQGSPSYVVKKLPDMCPSCAQEFWKWWESGKQKPNPQAMKEPEIRS